MNRVTLIKKTKYGKLSHFVTEQYLRDDISCGVFPCALCETKKGLSHDFPRVGAIKLEDCKDLYIPDETFFDSQIDMIKFCKYVSNVVCLESVMNMLQEKYSHRAIGRTPSKYAEVKEIIESGYRGFYYFSNEHFKPTYVVFSSGSHPR